MIAVALMVLPPLRSQGATNQAPCTMPCIAEFSSFGVEDLFHNSTQSISKRNRTRSWSLYSFIRDKFITIIYLMIINGYQWNIMEIWIDGVCWNRITVMMIYWDHGRPFHLFRYADLILHMAVGRASTESQSLIELRILRDLTVARKNREVPRG